MTRNADRPEPDRLLPLAEAAARLGIAYDTARKRLKAGTLVGERRGGRWYVRVPNPDGADAASGHESGRVPVAEPDASGPVPDARDRLIAALEADVSYLREQLDHSRRALAAERERFDVILREAVARVPPAPQLAAGQASRGDERGGPGGAAGTAPAPAARRTRWRGPAASRAELVGTLLAAAAGALAFGAAGSWAATVYGAVRHGHLPAVAAFVTWADVERAAGLAAVVSVPLGVALVWWQIRATRRRA